MKFLKSILNLKIFSSSIKNKYEREKAIFDKKHNKIGLLADTFPIEAEIPGGIKYINDIVFIPYECEILKQDFQNKKSNSQKQYNLIVSCLKKILNLLLQHMMKMKKKKIF